MLREIVRHLKARHRLWQLPLWALAWVLAKTRLA
jgi:hypothetical protein